MGAKKKDSFTSLIKRDHMIWVDLVDELIGGELGYQFKKRQDFWNVMAGYALAFYRLTGKNLKPRHGHRFWHAVNDKLMETHGIKWKHTYDGKEA